MVDCKFVVICHPDIDLNNDTSISTHENGITAYMIQNFKFYCDLGLRVG